VSAAFAYAVGRAAQNGRSRSQEGEWIFPEGGSTDISDYDAVMTNGILGDRESFALLVDREGIPGYFNPSGGLLADVGQAFRQKFFGWAGDPLAEGFARGLAGLDKPMTIIGHSQGTLAIRNAARYYGLPEGSTLVMRSPAMSYWSARSAANAINGNLQYVQPWGDVANLYAPSLNPLKWASGLIDPFCAACVHRGNSVL